MIVDALNRKACVTPNCVGGIAENINWVFQPSKAYYQSDGITIIATTDPKALMPATFTNVAAASAQYWTGLGNNDWTTDVNNCSNWSSTVGSSTFGGASPNSDSAKFTNTWGIQPCNVAHPLLCVQQ